MAESLRAMREQTGQLGVDERKSVGLGLCFVYTVPYFSFQGVARGGNINTVEYLE
jgi:hypothetical protein